MSFYFWMDILSLFTLLFDIHWLTNTLYDPKSNHTKENIIFNILKTIRIARLAYIMKFVKNSYQDKYYSLFDYLVHKLKMKEDKALIILGRKKKTFTTTSTKKTIKTAEKYDSTSQSGFEDNLKQKFVDDAIEANRKGNILADEDEISSGELKELSQGSVRPQKAFESKLARRIIYLTNKRLMMMILIMLVFVPMFSVQFFTNLEEAFEKDIGYISKVFHVAAFDKTKYMTTLNEEYSHYQTSILEIEIDDFKKTLGSEEGLRFNEVLSFESSNVTILDSSLKEKTTVGKLKISIREFIRWQAILDLLRTLFVVLLFYIAIYFFMFDATRLIIDPLERLLDQVKEMSKNPSKALKMAEKRKSKRKKHSHDEKSDLDSIKETISKLAYLLVLGFGRAGDSVISKILYSKNMNLQIKSSGTKIYGIFGFCDIRNFTDVTEVLGTEVIRYVNTVGDIVHKIVDKYKGGANKNIGDAFLLVWKLKDKKSDIEEFTKHILSKEEIEKIWARYEPLKNYEKDQPIVIGKAKAKKNFKVSQSGDDNLDMENLVRDHETNRTSVMDKMNDAISSQKTYAEVIKDWDLAKVQEKAACFTNNLKNSTMAELSLISFLKCIEGVTTDPRITSKYNKHPAINKKLPNYYVKLGFGLHAGWAVEGALGSKYKIDLSYLSPNVDMSSRLEGLTKIYKKALLFTNSIFNLMTSESLKKICRKIDRVFVNGKDVMELFTVDLSVEYLQYMSRFYKLGAKGKIDNSKIQNYGIKKKGKRYRASIGTNYISIQNDITKIDLEDYKEFNKIERTYEEILMDKNLCFLLCIDNKENKDDRKNFIEKFEEAFFYYEEGEWNTSIQLFETLMKEYIVDGEPDVPCKVLVNFMKKTNGVPSEEFEKHYNSRVCPDE